MLAVLLRDRRQDAGLVPGLVWHASWVQNVVRQFGLYLLRAYRDWETDRKSVV